jgi:hypothetical protein
MTSSDRFAEQGLRKFLPADLWARLLEISQFPLRYDNPERPFSPSRMDEPLDTRRSGNSSTRVYGTASREHVRELKLIPWTPKMHEVLSKQRPMRYDRFSVN